MRLLVIMAAALLGIPALADLAPVDASRLPIYQAQEVAELPLNSGATIRGAGTAYSNMDAGPNGYVAYPSAEGVLGVDDYDSVFNCDITLTQFKFVGGVTNAGEILLFGFYDFDTQDFVDGFSVQFAQGGNYLWTITIGEEVIVPDHGILQIETDAASGTTGQWFLGDAGPTIGTEDPMQFGSGDGAFSQNFAITGIPEPTSLGLLILGAAALIRRR
jgi:hypothetical protein